MGSNISLFEMKDSSKVSLESKSITTNQKYDTKSRKFASRESLVYTPESHPMLAKRSRKSLSFPDEQISPHLNNKKFSCRITPDKGSLLAAFFRVFGKLV